MYEFVHKKEFLNCFGSILGNWKKDVTKEMKNFYEEYPFPNYDDHDDVSSLVQKSKTVYLQLLDDQIHSIKVIECGCGTDNYQIFYQ